ncbi:MAG: class I SAM-dependent methyltransferase [Methanomicrobiaceae archaeon]|nr:class I SAM-dependent methyltransferase [Methanomicrobiaceae archaeon]MDD5418752.1 class I SAM-dependent methyltransferase [Methanomicrobiaceae archaeon]
MTSYRHEDDAERRRWQDPEAILAGIGLAPGSVFVDVGCGDGFFALPAARIVGPNGRVCGIDIDADALDRLRRTAERDGLANIRLREGAAETTILCEGCTDFVFFGISLHDFSDQQRVLACARAMLAPAGLLVNLDWKKETTGPGPPHAKRFSVEYAAAIIRKAGFSLRSVAGAGPYHYIMVAEAA